MKHDEARLQTACVMYCRAQYRDIVVHYVQNEFKGNAISGRIAKTMGKLAGFPDLLVFLPSAKVLLIEFKSNKGTLSKEQKDLHPRLEALGHSVFIVRDFDSFKSIIDQAYRAAIRKDDK